MARHSFIVEVAKEVGTEPAIVENTLAYRADRFGKKNSGRIEFTVSIDELERDYGYFIFNIDECLEDLSRLRIGDEYAYRIDTLDIGGRPVAFVAVLEDWIYMRRCF